MSEFRDSDDDVHGFGNRVIVLSHDPSLEWLNDAQRVLIDHRKKMDDVFVAWAVAINGLHVAVERYSDPKWVNRGTFVVTAIRASAPRRHERMVIRRYPDKAASEVHRSAQSHLTTWGFVEYYGTLDDLVFALFRCFLTYNPLAIIDKRQSRDLWDLHQRRNGSPENQEAWKSAWTSHLERWQRNRLYDGLHLLLRDFLHRTQLQPPSWAEMEPESWARTLRLMSEVRNSLVHGAKEASPRLAEIVSEAGRANAGLVFEESDPLNIGMAELWKIELFGTQLTGSLQASMGERVLEGPNEFLLIE